MPKKPPTVPVTVRLTRDEAKTMKRGARETGQSRSAYIVALLRWAMNAPQPTRSAAA